MNYSQLKNGLDAVTAARWMIRDAIDDFFPDPIGLADIKGHEDAYVARHEHRWLQIDAPPHLIDFVPKRSGMLREAVILHPLHRIVYLAILRHFIAKLDRHLESVSYSYRLDASDDDNSYPFPHRVERWKTFHNDFRIAALGSTCSCVVLTDLAAFYDHISCEQLGHRIRSLLGPAKTDEDEDVIQLLVRLLRLWCTDGHGIPQNHDPSSFFGSLYLHGIDHEMVANGFRYFRWVDDIRIVAASHDEAVRALHYLQRLLAKRRLFLATEKTKIIPKGRADFAALLNVEDDVLISEVEERTRASDCGALDDLIPRLFDKLKKHAEPDGDDRKFRAFANRLLDIAAFGRLAPQISNRLEAFILPRLRSHPERSDYWTKLLAATASKNVQDAVADLLVDHESLFTWQRFHLWKLALQLPRPVPEALVLKARSVAGTVESDAVAAQAIVFLGAVSSNTDRETLFNAHFSRQRSYLVQRAVLLAIQELPSEQRDRLFDHALAANSSHAELVQYLRNLALPNYGITKRPRRDCPEVPVTVTPVLRRGLGLVNGTLTQFTLTANELDYD